DDREPDETGERLERAGLGTADVHGQEGTAHSGYERAQRSHDDLDLDDVHAQRSGCGLAVPNGPQRESGGGSTQVDDERREDQEDDERKVGEGQLSAGEPRWID